MRKADLDMSRGSVTRVWLVLGLLAKFEKGLLLTDIARESNMKVKSTNDVINRIESGQLPGIMISRTNKGEYYISDWGPFFNRKNFLFFHESLT